ncbi:MAG TPA: M10 family metallopeptidase C-terminal domain-containing protein [Allosphingosinicella sp.]|jgi:Ca2+-binding RTX toxin-like protein
MTTGTSGNDRLEGGAGDDVLEGVAGDDVLIGGAGTDRTDGGTGNDRHYVDSAADIVVERAGEGTDTVFASVSYALAPDSYIEALLAADAASTTPLNLTGNDFNQKLTGNAGANVLDGRGGADTMNGGAGDDSYYVDNVGDSVIESSATGGSDTVRSSVGFSLAGRYIETLVLTGTAAINGTGNSLTNTITGNSAANVLNGGEGADTMNGGDGNDTYYVDNAGDNVIESNATGGSDIVRSSVSFSLAGRYIETLVLTGSAAIDGTGNSHANAITGNAAANVLNGGAGADTLNGGNGNDTYYVDDIGDKVIESSATGGTDTVYSSVSFTAAGRYVEKIFLTGSNAIDGTGNSHGNEITGNAAANVLNGAEGADRLEGGAGNDTYYVDNAGDVVIESSASGGTDTVRSSVSFVMAGQYVENLFLTGGNAVNGTGNGLANAITGNGAANTLSGGAGSDTLTGGAGADRFLFDAALGAGNIDKITDFTAGTDKIVLAGDAGAPFAALATGNLATGAFRAASAAADVDDRILYNSGTGALLYDADGVGGAAAVQFATVGTGLSLSAATFQVSGAANSLPTITSAASGSVQENVATSTVVYQTVASDADGDRIVYSLSGTDAARFTIDQSGAVRFVSSPDFETKNAYSFTVSAVDSTGVGDSQAVSLSVTDVSETKPLYTVAETSSANDSIALAQALDRSKFAPTTDSNVTDPSLPTAKITGKVAAGGDEDFFSVTLKAGELLVLDVDGTTTLDSFVRVFGPDGTELTSNDDQIEFDAGSTAHQGVAHNMDSLIRVRAPADGTYTFSVASLTDADTGTATSSGGYTVNVSIGPPAGKEQIDQENVDSLLSGASWSSTNVTYGFTTTASDYASNEGIEEIKAGMRGLNLTQQATVKTVLAQVTNLTDLSFTQVTTKPGTAQMRYALSGDPDTAHAYYPGPGDGGDSWYNTTRYTTPKVGNYQWTTFIHETGHALGLKHGHESPALSPDRDSMEYSVMTYRAYIGASVDDGSGYGNETWGFAQTFMMYDIAALQQMYGADFTFNGGNSIYTWNATTGAFLINGAVQWTPGGNRVFMTIWDGGGTDTYDLSNYSGGVKIDLRPGEWTTTSKVQLADLGDAHYARGNVANALLYNDDPRSLIENAIGGAGADVITANGATNRLTGGGGIDTFRWFEASDSAPGASADTILDFQRGTDKLDVSGIDAIAGTPENDSFTLIHGNAFSGTAGELRLATVGNTVHVYGDVDGNGAADYEVIATFTSGTPEILDSQFVL